MADNLEDEWWKTEDESGKETVSDLSLIQ